MQQGYQLVVWIAGVRKNSLMVLTHLIMNDMMKVKGHIARMALALRDPDSRIAALAELFFHELAQKAYKVSHGMHSVLCCRVLAYIAVWYSPLLAPTGLEWHVAT